MSDQKRPVSAVDSLWLHMDTPENLMVIEGIMTFSEPLDFDRAVQVIKHRIPDRYPVFRQMPVPSALATASLAAKRPANDSARPRQTVNSRGV